MNTREEDSVCLHLLLSRSGGRACKQQNIMSSLKVKEYFEVGTETY